MRQKSNSTPVTSVKLVRDIRRATRKQYSAEEKIIRIVLDGLRGETPIARRGRREHVLLLVEGVPRCVSAWKPRIRVIGIQPPPGRIKPPRRLPARPREEPE